VIVSVLGAPGSGKTTIAESIRVLRPNEVVLDWDAFMIPAGELAGRAIASSPKTWPAYRHLVRAVVEVMAGVSVVLFTVCTPNELEGWPIDHWVLLDCDDQERRRRLLNRGARPVDLDEAVCDAAKYRSLGIASRRQVKVWASRPRG
jgi:broad-specificity NMP kinase